MCRSDVYSVTRDRSSRDVRSHNVDLVLMCQAGVELVKTFLYYRPLNSWSCYLGVRDQITIILSADRNAVCTSDIVPIDSNIGYNVIVGSV